MKNALESMKAIVANHPVISHLFLQRFRQGQLTKSQVITWFKQQFYFSISLPHAFAALYARMPYGIWQTSRPLIELLKVEAWGTDNPDSHSSHFIKLSKFLGLSLEMLTANPPEQYTQNYIDARQDMCLNPTRPLTQGLAAIALGNEYLNLFIFEAYKEGVCKVTGLEECPTGYFDAHLRDEESDFQVLQSLFDALAPGEDDLLSARGGVQELLDKRVIFFNCLSDTLDINS